MPEKSLRRRLLATGPRKTKPLNHLYPPPLPLRLPAKRSSFSKTVNILDRCLSEPIMRTNRERDQDDQKKKQRSLWPEDEVGDGDGVLHGPLTCKDVFASSPTLLMPFSAPVSPLKGYKTDAKVLVNVTVEGSPGPLRTMVKLGSSVEETIKVVVDKYSEEGRTPRLDKDATSTYELHHSHFSLQSLDKTELIGDVGCRSFYLRRSGSNRSVDGRSGETVQSMAISPPTTRPLPAFLLPVSAFIERKIGKIERRTRRLWKVLFCSQ